MGVELFAQVRPSTAVELDLLEPEEQPLDRVEDDPLDRDDALHQLTEPPPLEHAEEGEQEHRRERERRGDRRRVAEVEEREDDEVEGADQVDDERARERERRRVARQPEHRRRGADRGVLLQVDGLELGEDPADLSRRGAVEGDRGVIEEPVELGRADREADREDQRLADGSLAGPVADEPLVDAVENQQIADRHQGEIERESTGPSTLAHEQRREPPEVVKYGPRRRFRRGAAHRPVVA